MFFLRGLIPFFAVWNLFFRLLFVFLRRLAVTASALGGRAGLGVGATDAVHSFFLLPYDVEECAADDQKNDGEDNKIRKFHSLPLMRRYESFASRPCSRAFSSRSEESR